MDLSNRNRLLNTPRHRRRSRALEIVDELSEEIFRILVSERKAMSFLPGREPGEGEDREDGDDIFAGLIQPEDDEVDECGIAKRLLHPGEFSPGLNPHTVIFLVHPGFPGNGALFTFQHGFRRLSDGSHFVQYGKELKARRLQKKRLPPFHRSKEQPLRRGE